MDPFSILSIVQGSVDLAAKCVTVAKYLNDFATKHQQAELFVLSLVDECQTLRLAWGQIESWARRQNDAQVYIDDQIIERLGASLETGTMVISALEHELLQLGPPSSTGGFRWRNRIVWNEQAYRDHKDRVRGQIGAMTLLLEVISL